MSRSMVLILVSFCASINLVVAQNIPTANFTASDIHNLIQRCSRLSARPTFDRNPSSPRPDIIYIADNGRRGFYIIPDGEQAASFVALPDATVSSQFGAHAIINRYCLKLRSSSGAILGIDLELGSGFSNYGQYLSRSEMLLRQPRLRAQARAHARLPIGPHSWGSFRSGTSLNNDAMCRDLWARVPTIELSAHRVVDPFLHAAAAREIRRWRQAGLPSASCDTGFQEIADRAGGANVQLGQPYPRPSDVAHPAE